VEAKYPALLFKQQLDAFVQKIFPMLRDNVKKEITPQLAACIHAPRTAATRSRRGTTSPRTGSAPPQPGAPLSLLQGWLHAVSQKPCVLASRYRGATTFLGAGPPPQPGTRRLFQHTDKVQCCWSASAVMCRTSWCTGNSNLHPKAVLTSHAGRT